MSIERTTKPATKLRAVRRDSAGKQGGDKPVVVFLHGLGDGAGIWHSVFDAWPENLEFESIAFDLPGHGGSDWLETGQYSTTAMADAVTQALLENDIQSPILIGHSLGARVALEIAADSAIDPLLTVLIDMGPGRDTGELSESQKIISEHIDALIDGANSVEEFVEILLERLPLADPDTLEVVIPALLAGHPRPSATRVSMPLDPEIKSMLSAVRKKDVWTLLAEVRCPVAIVRGQFSGVLNRATATRMTQEVGNCFADETIKFSGHAIALEQPDELAEVLDRIVSKRLAAI